MLNRQKKRKHSWQPGRDDRPGSKLKSGLTGKCDQEEQGAALGHGVTVVRFHCRIQLLFSLRYVGSSGSALNENGDTRQRQIKVYIDIGAYNCSVRNMIYTISSLRCIVLCLNSMFVAAKSDQIELRGGEKRPSLESCLTGGPDAEMISYIRIMSE